MAFFVRVLFATALVYTVNAGVLTGEHHDDSYVSSALSAPSASYGAPSTSYGPPATSYGAPAISGSLNLDTHLDSHSHGLLEDHHDHGHLSAPVVHQNVHDDAPYPSGPYTEGSLNLPTSIGGSAPLAGPLPATLPALGSYAPAFQAALPATTAVGPPRVIGTSVTVGRPIATATRYELQSVVQNVVRRVPVEVTRHVQVAVPHPVPVPVRQEVKVPVPQPYPVHVDVVKHVPYPVYKTQHHEVERPVPVEVVKHVPFEVIRKVHVPVDKPYEVIKKIHVPIEKHVHVPYAVWKPYPLHIIKHVTHYEKKKKSVNIYKILFLSAKGSRDDPQIFTASTPATPLPPPTPLRPSPSPQPNFGTREIIVYLTPTQIKALQTGHGILEPILDTQPQLEQQQSQQQEQQQQELPQIPHGYENDEEFKKELERQKAYIETQPNIDEAISVIQNQKEKTPPPVREPSREGSSKEPDQYSWYPKGSNQYYSPAPQNQYQTTATESNQYYGPSTEQLENGKLSAHESEDLENLHPKSYNYFSVHNEKKGNNINIKIFHPAPRDKIRDELDAKELDAQKYAPLIKKYKWVPYEYKASDWQTLEGLAEGSRVIQKNAEHQLSALFAPAQPEKQSQSLKYEQENSNANLEEESLKLKYASRYNDQKQAIEIQNIIKKQNALAQVEAIAQSPPVEVHREVSITKHKPIPIIKHVQVPVPQPYFVRVPEPFEVKVPQPYPVPLEIIRPVPVEVVKTEKIEVEKPVPYEVEKRVPVPVTKKVYVKVDKPYVVEKVVPVQIRKEVPVHIPIHQKLTILRHVWEH